MAKSTTNLKKTLDKKTNQLKKNWSSYKKEVNKDPKKKWGTIAILLVLLFGILFLFKKDWFIVATVNGQPVTRMELIGELERQNGKQTLDSIITQKLIAQKANEKGINVTKEDVDVEINNLKKQFEDQGTTLEALLTMQGQTMDDLRKNIKIRLMVEKLLSDKLTVSDDEVKEYFDANSDQFPEGTNLDDVKDQIVEQIKNQKINDEYQTWLQDVRSKASINYIKNY